MEEGELELTAQEELDLAVEVSKQVKREGLELAMEAQVDKEDLQQEELKLPKEALVEREDLE